MSIQRFGVMVDCSRNGVMKPTELMRFIDIIAKMGYNCLELYTEDTYEVENEPYFGYLRGRYTDEELRAVDKYAIEHGVELIPAIQTLAHYPALQKNYTMASLFDINDILLCDNEKTYELLDNCFASLAKKFTSRNVNIGMDEAHLLGLGKYLDIHGYTERYDILMRHLSRVNEIAGKYGFKPHMWSDMFFRPINDGKYVGKNLHLPKEVCERIPENVGLVYWDYYSRDKEIYEDMLTAHTETGRETWFAGGMWGWYGFAPYNRFTLQPLKPAMETVRERNIQNVIITLWGDGGKECSYFSLLPALYAARQFALGVTDMERVKKSFEELFGISYDDFCLLDLPNDTGKENFNGTGWPENPSRCLFFQDPFQGFYDWDYSHRDAYIPYGEYAERLRSASSRAGEFAYIFRYLAELCSFLEIKACLGIKTRDLYRANDLSGLKMLVGEYDEACSRLESFYQAFYTVWHKENKSFGWEVQDIRLGGLERRLRTCKNTLTEYLDGKIDKIEELEEDILPTGKVDILENRLSYIATRSNLD